MNNSTNSILNRPAVGLMPNYPKKQGKMFHIELGQNEGPFKRKEMVG